MVTPVVTVTACDPGLVYVVQSPVLNLVEFCLVKWDSVTGWQGDLERGLHIRAVDRGTQTCAELSSCIVRIDGCYRRWQSEVAVGGGSRRSRILGRVEVGASGLIHTLDGNMARPIC